MRRHSKRAAEGAREMTHRQAALPRHLLERHTLKVGAKNFLRPSLLPWREPTPERPRHWPHASVGLSDMHPKRHEDVVDKERIGLIGMVEGGEQQVPQSRNHDVVDARSGPIAQVANSRRVGIVGNRVQRRTGEIERQSVIGLVEESSGFSFQIRKNEFAGPQIAHRSLSAFLPIFATWTIAELQTDDKSIFLPQRAAHFRKWIVTSNLRDGNVSFTQCAANDRGCILDLKSLA